MKRVLILGAAQIDIPHTTTIEMPKEVMLERLAASIGTPYSEAERLAKEAQVVMRIEATPRLEDLGEIIVSTGNIVSKRAESKTNEFLKREEELDAKFKAGGCTAGDMKYTRHRNMVYINNYPCGSRCEKCGTFFID